MSEGSSSKIYPSLDEVPRNEDLNTFTSANPMATPTDLGNTDVHSQSHTLDGQENLTEEANTHHDKEPNAFTSSHFSTTPLPPNVSGQSQISPKDDEAKLTSQINKEQPLSYEQCYNVPIVAIGNPGSGKSTILNSLAGEVLFGSGISLGEGFTSQLEIKEANGQTFIDTPGVADETYKQAAAEALTKVFNQGGRMKILFFITQDAGRIVVQDSTTMKMILEAVPEIGQNYGILVNKVPEKVLSEVSQERNFLKLFQNIKTRNTLLLPLHNQLEDKNCARLHPSEIHKDLMDFINSKVPEAYITPGKITEIELYSFEELSKQVKNLESELKSQEREKAVTQEKLNQYKIEEKEKKKQDKKILQIKEEELQQMEKKIRDKKEEIKDYAQRSEDGIKDLQQRRDDETKRLEQKEKEITIKKAQINKKKEAAEQRKDMMKRSKDLSLQEIFGTDFGLKNASVNT